MRRAQQIQLTEEQRAELKKLVSTGTGPARVLTRARIILMAARGEGNQQIADALEVSWRTVIRIKARFREEGLDVIKERARPGRPPRITGDIEAKLIMLACSAPPEGRSRWTLQLLADKMVELQYIDTISDVGVMKRLKKTGLDLGR
ncbi:MAG: helix-turn-helix domain-containing protein [Chloroflexia bacterium]